VELRAVSPACELGRDVGDAARDSDGRQATEASPALSYEGEHSRDTDPEKAVVGTMREPGQDSVERRRLAAGSGVEQPTIKRVEAGQHGGHSHQRALRPGGATKSPRSHCARFPRAPAGDLACMTTSVQRAKGTARHTAASKPVKGLARFGLASRGLVYIVIGLLALQIALGRGGRADRNGALAAIKDQPLGGALLIALAVGFAGYAGWRLLQAAVGHRDVEQSRKRAVERIGSLVRAAVYASFARTTVEFITAGGGHDETRPLTARVMTLPGGRLLVGLVGLAVVGSGLYMAYRGIAKKFLERLDLASASATMRQLATLSGLVGQAGRGLVFCLLGGFLIESAITFDPDKAKGLDAALKTLASQPFGQLLLAASAVGLLAFGMWSFVEARYRKV
jgi:hypothetical protein